MRELTEDQAKKLAEWERLKAAGRPSSGAARDVGASQASLCRWKRKAGLPPEPPAPKRITRDEAAYCASQALGHVLDRIKYEPAVQALIAAGSPTFDELTSAYALLTGNDLDFTRNYFIPGAAALGKFRYDA